jgi:hypothetical protein
MTRYVSDGTEDVVERVQDTAFVRQGKGYSSPARVSCIVENTGNGYIAQFPSHSSTRQDYYVCLDYAQARDLVLGLAEFKKELGFE